MLAFVAPSMAAAFAAAIYLLTKYIVLARENATRAGLWASPLFFFLTTTIVTMSIGMSSKLETKERVDR
jgi:sodium-dependent phosphate transporter